MHLLLFGGLLAACCLYALWRGGAPERVVGMSLLAATFGTAMGYSALPVRFLQAENMVLVIDILLLSVLVGVALRADRGWPLALAGLQLDTVGAHLVRMQDLGMSRVAYALMLAIWSYPMLVLLAIGTARHQRRLKDLGHDLAWMVPRQAERFGPSGETATAECPRSV